MGQLALSAFSHGTLAYEIIPLRLSGPSWDADIRTPFSDFAGDTLAVIRDLGLVYDSSLMADEPPYEIVAEGQTTGPAKLPANWIVDDYAYYSYDRRSDVRPNCTDGLQLTP